MSWRFNAALRRLLKRTGPDYAITPQLAKSGMRDALVRRIGVANVVTDRPSHKYQPGYIRVTQDLVRQWHMHVSFIDFLAMLVAFALYHIIPLSYSYPITDPLNHTFSSNNTQAVTHGWVDAPDVRGTSAIITSALGTLVLCAWTAFHPNVCPQQSRDRHTRRRAIWTLLTMFLPEIVLYCAWEQWWAAKGLLHQHNVAIQEIDVNEPESDCKPVVDAISRTESQRRSSTDTIADFIESFYLRPYPVEADGGAQRTTRRTTKSLQPWSMEQAYFAASGGIAIDSNDFWPMPSMTFTPSGINELLRLGPSPVIPEIEIEDKGKADALTKALTIIQAGWYVIQMLSRLCQKLPLTLLEIHIMIHVFCAFAMYYFWFNKPYNAGYPVLISDEMIINVAALFVVDENAVSRYYESDEATILEEPY